MKVYLSGGTHDGETRYIADEMRPETLKYLCISGGSSGATDYWSGGPMRPKPVSTMPTYVNTGKPDELGRLVFQWGPRP